MFDRLPFFLVLQVWRGDVWHAGAGYSEMNTRLKKLDVKLDENGIGDARAMVAAFALGAEGVQIGSRFVATPESSAHQAFKDEVVAAGEGATRLSLKALTPVRLLDNSFAREVMKAENAGQSAEELKSLLGRGRAKKGMFEGDLENGELEIGQVSSLIEEVKPAAEVLAELVEGYEALTRGMEDHRFRWV